MWNYQIKTNNLKNQTWLIDAFVNAGYKVDAPLIVSPNGLIVVVNSHKYISYNFNINNFFGHILDMSKKEDFVFICKKILKLKPEVAELPEKKIKVKNKFRAGDKIKITKLPGQIFACDGMTGTIIQILSKIPGIETIKIPAGYVPVWPGEIIPKINFCKYLCLSAEKNHSDIKSWCQSSCGGQEREDGDGSYLFIRPKDKKRKPAPEYVYTEIKDFNVGIYLLTFVKIKI